MSSTNTIVDFTSSVQNASSHHAPTASFSSTTSSSSTSSSENNDFEIQANPDNELPFHSKKQLIQFRPTHHDIFHSSNFNGPSFKQIIFAFVMLVSVTSLCSYLYKDSLVNVLLILETLPWWWTSLFFCVLFTLVSLPFAWGKNDDDRTSTSLPSFLGYILLNIACGFLYGLVYGVIFLVIYVAIGLSFSFVLCRFILRHDYWVIKNLKTTFERSQIIQTLIKVLNSTDGYKIIFLSRLTPVSVERRRRLSPDRCLSLIRFLSVYKMGFMRSVIFHFVPI